MFFDKFMSNIFNIKVENISLPLFRNEGVGLPGSLQKDLDAFSLKTFSVPRERFSEETSDSQSKIKEEKGTQPQSQSDSGQHSTGIQQHFQELHQHHGQNSIGAEVHQRHYSVLRNASESNLKLTGQILEDGKITQGAIELGPLYGGRQLSALPSFSQSNVFEDRPSVDHSSRETISIHNGPNISLNFAKFQETITIEPLNNNPNAVNDGVFSLIQGNSLSVNVLGNDTDPDGNALSIIQVNGSDITEGGGSVAVANGTVSVVAGELVFTPTAGYNGHASFNYTVSDTDGAVDTATVELKVLPVSFKLSSLDGDNGFKLTGSGGERSGFSVSSAGDINGDGYDDIIIGAPYNDGGGTDAGRSYVVFGSADGYNSSTQLKNLNGTNGFKLVGIDNGDNSGWSVSGAGDINGDGFEDLIIGSSGGLSYVLFGKADGYADSLELSSLDGSNGFAITGGGVGVSVSSAGDFNGDGYADLLIGSPSGNSTYLMYGHGGDFEDSITAVELRDGINGFRFTGSTQDGGSVSGGGDINGDGFSDIIIGGSLTNSQNGISYVVFGGDQYSSNSFLLGTSEDDIITGTVGADNIIGAQGNDTLYSAGRCRCYLWGCR